MHQSDKQERRREQQRQNNRHAHRFARCVAESIAVQYGTEQQMVEAADRKKDAENAAEFFWKRLAEEAEKAWQKRSIAKANEPEPEAAAGRTVGADEVSKYNRGNGRACQEHPRFDARTH